MRTDTAAMSRPEWLPESEYPFRLRTLEMGAESVTYVDEGEGPTLLFVHTGMWSFVFREVITRLRDDFRCITLDFPGFGLSPEPSNGELTLEAQSSLLGRFAGALELEHITLVLHDLGGPVGMGFASTRPDRVQSLVMANTFAWQPRKPALVTMLRAVSSRPMTAFDAATRFIPRVTATRFGVGRHLSRGGKKAFRGPFRDRSRVRRFHTTMRDALASDDLYRRIAVAVAGPLRDLPVLTIFGERNDPFGFQDRHHATFPNHQGVVVAKGNHFPMLDDPDLFAGSMREWWRGLD